MYVPDLSQTVILSTGKPMHLYYDHANHNGFDSTDHRFAAEWHTRQSAGARTPEEKNFHAAQAKLHDRASHGKSNKIRHVPNPQIFSSMPEPRKSFWVKQSQQTQQNNDELKQLEPYRMSNVLKTKMFSKSDVDYTQMKHAEQDKHPTAPVLTPQESVLDEQARRILAERRAARHNVATDGMSSGDPRKNLDDEQKELIRQALARRKGGY